MKSIKTGMRTRGKRNKKNADSLTLIELVITITITGILAVGLGKFIIQAVDTWDFVSDRSDLVNRARFGVMRMGRDIRQASSINAATAIRLDFIRGDSSGGALMRYRYVAGNNRIVYRLDENGNGNLNDESDRLFLPGVTAFQFSYFDNTGTDITPPADLSAVYRIRIQLTLAVGGRTMPLNYEIFLRNSG